MSSVKTTPEQIVEKYENSGNGRRPGCNHRRSRALSIRGYLRKLARFSRGADFVCAPGRSDIKTGMTIDLISSLKEFYRSPLKTLSSTATAPAFALRRARRVLPAAERKKSALANDWVFTGPVRRYLEQEKTSRSMVRRQRWRSARKIVEAGVRIEGSRFRWRKGESGPGIQARSLSDHSPQTASFLKRKTTICSWRFSDAFQSLARGQDTDQTIDSPVTTSKIPASGRMVRLCS